MKKIVLCSALTMAFANFANAETCPGERIVKAALKENSAEVEKQGAFSFKSVEDTWKASDFSFYQGNKVPVDDLIKLELSILEVQNQFCRAFFENPNVNYYPLTFDLKKQ